ncbi:MAG: hypothetical protein WBC33_13420, partial [Conexibacter sp.]
MCGIAAIVGGAPPWEPFRLTGRVDLDLSARSEARRALMARLREASMPAGASLTDTELLERAARWQLGLEALREAQTMSALTEEEA